MIQKGQNKETNCEFREKFGCSETYGPKKRNTCFLQSLTEKCTKLETAVSQQRNEEVTVETIETVTRSLASAESPLSPASRTPIHGSTVVTRVEERSSFDVSRLIADLDARDAELAVLRAVLTQKENQLQVRSSCRFVKN